MAAMIIRARRLLENHNVLGAVAIVALWSMLAYKDIGIYSEAVSDTITNANNIALAVEQHINPILIGADEDLRYARGAFLAGKDEAQKAFTRYKITHSNFERFSVIDADGIMIMSSFLPTLPTQSFSEREYFKELRANPNDILYISKNLISFLSGKEIFYSHVRFGIQKVSFLVL